MVNDREARHKSPYRENPSKQPSGFVYSISPPRAYQLFSTTRIRSPWGCDVSGREAAHTQDDPEGRPVDGLRISGPTSILPTCVCPT